MVKPRVRRIIGGRGPGGEKQKMKEENEKNRKEGRKKKGNEDKRKGRNAMKLAKKTAYRDINYRSVTLMPIDGAHR